MRTSLGTAEVATAMVEEIDGIKISRTVDRDNDLNVVPQQNYDGMNNVSDQRLRQRFHASKDVECKSKYEKLTNILDAPLLNLIALKELSWSGVPRQMRAFTCRLLAGYPPTSIDRRNTVLERKRADYRKLVQQYFHVDAGDKNMQDTYRQRHNHVPRMNPHVALFQQKLVQEMFERIIFIWAIRHPAFWYIQGINDLVTPSFSAFHFFFLFKHHSTQELLRAESKLLE